jgi:Flp pilus assembly protein CpaB
MTPYSQRRSGGLFAISGPLIAGTIALLFLVTLGALWAFGVVTIPTFFRPAQASTAGLVPVPIPARTIPAYTKVMRDHLWDPAQNQLTFVHLQPRAMTPEMLVNLNDILGRVLDHDKPAGYVFTETDFLPKGTREGLVGGIPPGKRAVRVPADKVEGLYGLRPGDRFDLVATLPIDAGRGGAAQAFNVGGVYGQQLALQARMSNWQKQATVHVMVQNGVIVEPMSTRQVPVFTNTLTQGGVTRMRPVQEAVVAVDPDEVAQLTEAMAVEAKISTVPRSGHPDDPIDSVTPDLRPTSPFAGPGSGPGAAPAPGPAGQPPGSFAVVETFMGPKRELTTVPRQ